MAHYRTGRRDCHEEYDGDAKQHKQDVAQAQRTTVLLLGASKISGRGKIDARADSASQQVNQQRHECGGTEEQKERREKAHGSA
jgi:hypothetical protein